MNYPKVTVHGDGSKHFLRIHLSADAAGMVRFESEHAYTKSEADFRAVMLSYRHGFERDELPTHPQIEPYPKA